MPVITVLDEATPYVVRKYIEHIPLYERVCVKKADVFQSLQPFTIDTVLSDELESRFCFSL